MPNGLLAREGTSDEGTWHDVFDEDKAYHRCDLKNPKRIIDLGAYCGYTTWDFLGYSDCSVLAVEPNLDNFELLKKNIPKDDDWRVTFANAAIGAYNGYGRLIGEHFNNKRLESGANVRVYTLDSLLDEAYYFKSPAKIDYIKFDIEGTEREVLKQTDVEWPSRTSRVKIELHDEYHVSQCIADLNLLGFHASQDNKHDSAVIGWREL